jgi:hypothetical protein
MGYTDAGDERDGGSDGEEIELYKSFEFLLKIKMFASRIKKLKYFCFPEKVKRGL